VKRRLDNSGMEENHATNISSVIEDFLDEDYTYEEIGRIFASSLSTGKSKDYLAFGTYLPHDVRKIQKVVMSNLKTKLLVSSYEDKDIPDFYLLDNINPESLLGTINDLVKEKGEEIFAGIGEAVHAGSKRYLRTFPEAINTNIDQFKEYNAILRELDKLY